MTYQQYPPQGGYPPPGAYPPPGMALKPSGATGIIAGILAILGGVWFLSGLVWVLILLVDRVRSYYIVGGILDLAVGVVLLVGGILLLRRKRAGRMLVVIGAGAGLFFGIVLVVLRTTGMDVAYVFGGVSAIYGFLGLIVQLLIPAVATIVLALLPPTGRWLAAGKQPAVPMSPQNFGHPQPPPGYPPAGYPPPQQGPPPGQW
ncbi:hypothetical protein [Amycolatopsis regifaucium]|uniref:Uncharacterized protein n=1 Tax=Amycolatopsis regifaucium TaxID=546365 RepID=A0A154MTZ3_9PSEU|nr:hypothetical protein [Amycolatopsis regifaucium]KZB87580.1 hypothetical protein AVL48_23495 [Amycolatopsis regifaucium]OKA08409.1 hypothetical protein ATP06_0214255 [Amycolatopsis regifaucium]SFI09866.1 hypothetical protein SAMN04489731_108172 [Amycolatopsis regifaucium]